MTKDKVETKGEAEPAPYWTQVRQYYVNNTSLAIANTLQWYQYTAYGVTEVYIAKAFFNGSDTLGWLAFATTFAIRPLGGIFFGLAADKYGRRPALLACMGMMTAATASFGLMPRVPVVGGMGIVLCSVLTGLATGGEVGGLATYLAEGSRHSISGAATSLVGLGGQLGFALSASVVLGLQQVLTPQQMVSWG
mmetsp:Transcript_120048/g.208966  ORF Transcript_120048/g.208966 Transcript_120048/m.208966 type:complete len:193 (+) Transcript_120048:68-646(+)